MTPRQTVLAVIAALSMAGCGSSGEGAEPERPRQLGQEIVVTGSVQRRIDATSFVIRTEGDVRGLLVVAPSEPVEAAEVVEVRGVVRRFERRTVEGQLHRRLDRRRYGQFEGLEFLRADRVVVRR